jgi:hypothetical protein
MTAQSPDQLFASYKSRISNEERVLIRLCAAHAQDDGRPHRAVALTDVEEPDFDLDEVMDFPTG